jgi:hypothetical protein
MRTSTLAGAALVAALAAALLTGCDDRTTTESQDHRITVPVDRLSVRAGAGDVEVTGSDVPGVLVHEVLRYAHGRRPRTSRAVHDGALTLGYTCPHVRSWQSRACGVSYRIQVPRGIPVTAETGVGHMRATDLAGTLRLTDSTGDVVGTGLTGGDVTAVTDVGDVRLRLLATPARVRGSSATGDVSITVPAGHPYRVSARTDVGHRHVSIPDDPSAPSAIDARTDTGSVRVAAG